MHGLVVVLALVSGVSKGGKLYVKGDGVEMTAKADGSGAKTPLPAGTEVTWLGTDDKRSSMNLVEHKGKKGFIATTSLTPNKAADEITSNGPPPPAATPAEDSLSTLRALAASTQEQQANIAEHAKKSGLKAGGK